jgi:hypothetical protein
MTSSPTMPNLLLVLVLLAFPAVGWSVELPPAWQAVRDQALERSERLSYPVERDRLLDEVCAAVGAGILDRKLPGEVALGLLESIPVFKLGYQRDELMQAIERGVLVVQSRRDEEAARAAAAKPMP